MAHSHTPLLPQDEVSAVVSQLEQANKAQAEAVVQDVTNRLEQVHQVSSHLAPKVACAYMRLHGWLP